MTPPSGRETHDDVEVPDASHGLPITHAAHTTRLLNDHLDAVERE